MNRLRRILATDPRGQDSLILWTGVSVLAVLALVLRLRLSSAVNTDYTTFLGPWYDHLKTYGLHGFRVRFSDYNFPYLFLLYVTTLLPVAKIVAFRLVAIAFDYVLAFAAHLIVRKVTGDRTRAVMVGVAALFLPTVFINSSYWGQSDVVYTAFTLLCLHAVLCDRMLLAWTMFGVALAFKLQAVFFVPVLAFVWMRRKGAWYAPLVALPTFVLLSIPPYFAGRPLGDTLRVYGQQYDAYPSLTVSAPNLWTWFPASLIEQWNGPALILSVAVVGLLLLYCVLRVAYTPVNLIVVTALFLVIAPFVLPQMHERYFYGFEIVCLLLAALDHRRIWLVVVSQVVAFFSYSSFLFGTLIVPWPFLSLPMLTLVTYVLHLVVQCANEPCTPETNAS